jgi:hypothetical protein
MNTNDKYAQYTKSVRYTANGPIRTTTTNITRDNTAWIYALLLGLAIVGGIAFVFAIIL